MTEMQETLGMSKKAIELSEKYCTVVSKQHGGYIARMAINNQQFTFTRIIEDKVEAEWFRCMLGKALEKLLDMETQ